MILVIEDDFSNRALLETFLGMEGFETVCVESSAITIGMLTSLDPPMSVLLNFSLSDDTGLELAQMIREVFPEAHLIGTTANIVRDKDRDLINTYFDSFMVKPLNMPQLLEYLRQSA